MGNRDQKPKNFPQLPDEEAVDTPVSEKSFPAPKPPERVRGQDSMRTLMKMSPNGIEVIATREGYHANRRIPEGRKFYVSGPAKLGSWMKCTDPENEKTRLKLLSEKKQKILKSAAE